MPAALASWVNRASFLAVRVVCGHENSLDGELALEGRILSAVHHAHGAAAKFAKDPVASELRQKIVVHLNTQSRKRRSKLCAPPSLKAYSMVVVRPA